MNKVLIYESYKNLIEEIKHVDKLQAFSRVITSEILLAAFIAIGFIFSPHGDLLPFNRLIGIIAICSCAIVFFTIFCLLDLYFHERLLIGSFAAALKMEKEHPWITPIHHNMIKNKKHPGSSSKKIIFYIGSIILMSIVIILSIIYIFNIIGLINMVVVCLLGGFAIFVYSFFLVKITVNFNALINKVVPFEEYNFKKSETKLVESDDEMYIEMDKVNTLYQHHYNEIKSKYKKVAATWAIGTLAACGYIIAGAEIGLPFSKFLGIVFLSVIGAGGINLLWFIDVGIYHRLLTAIFATTLVLEDHCKVLGKSNHYRMILLPHTKFKDPVLIDSLLYICMSILILIIGGIALFLNSYKQNLGFALVSSIFFIGITALPEIFFLGASSFSGYSRFKDR